MQVNQNDIYLSILTANLSATTALSTPAFPLKYKREIQKIGRVKGGLKINKRMNLDATSNYDVRNERVLAPSLNVRPC